MSDIKEIQIFLYENRSAYHKLLGLVRSACDRVKAELGDGWIADFYTRSRKQGETELKDAAGIFDKLEDHQKADRTAMRQIGDIVAATVVVYYPDHVEAVVQRIRSVLLEDGLKVSAPKLHKEGYFATHMVVRGTRGELQNLQCEIQCKTVLHNAWSEKMHDLTYKPRGRIDPKLDVLMRTIGRAIQSIERQTVLVRDMATVRHSLEQRAFRLSCQATFSDALTEQTEELESSAHRDRVKAIWARIREAENSPSTSMSLDESLATMADEIDHLSDIDEVSHHAWLLAGALARAWPRDYALLYEQQVEKLLAKAGNGRTTRPPSPKELSLVPMVFYSIGDFIRAIAYTDRICRDEALANLLKPDPEMVAVMRFNRINFLVEGELLRPSRDDARRKRIHSEAEAALRDPDIVAVVGLGSAIEDLNGLTLIAFGMTSDDIRKGIRVCEESARNAPDFERTSADAYLNWRLEAGWRRYFELAENEYLANSTSGYATSGAEE